MQIVLIDHGTGPDFGQQLILGDEVPRPADKDRQEVKRPWAKLDRASAQQQFSRPREERNGPNSNDAPFVIAVSR